MSAEKLPDRLPPDLSNARDEDPLTHVSRVYQFFLRTVFAAMPKGAGRYHWTNDPETTEITLVDKGPVGSEIIELRPAIITQRTDVAWQGMTLDQRQVGPEPATGERQHADMVSGSMLLHCIAKDGVVANRVASLVIFAITKFRRELTRLGNFHQVLPGLTASQEQPATSAMVDSGDSDFDFVEVLVQSPLHMRDEWLISTLDQDVLESIEGTLRAQMVITLTSEQKKRALRDVTYRGQLLQSLGSLDHDFDVSEE